MWTITDEEYRKDMQELKTENRIQTLFVLLAFFFSIISIKDILKNY